MQTARDERLHELTLAYINKSQLQKKRLADGGSGGDARHLFGDDGFVTLLRSVAACVSDF
ncbi:hypothetical protein [Exiguobacterium undae]|uniref:hypothetical protein n=1 Tax=Exiguobacterium undae TaxID=169177 RepID=UPI003851144F